MLRRRALFLVFCLSLLSISHAADERCIVVFKDGVDADAAANDLEKKNKAKTKRTYKHALNAWACSAADVNRLKDDGRVAYVAPDKAFSIGQFEVSGKKKGGTSTPSTQVIPTGVRRIHADLAWPTNKKGAVIDTDVDVAVIDTGIDLGHPDLNIFQQVTFVPGTINAQDDYGHGVHVAGIIGARYNSFGVVGVAPGARIWAIKAFDANGVTFWSDLIAAVDYVAAHASEIEVANMSFAGPGTDFMDPNFPDPFHQAIINASALGVVFVAAAGNSNSDVTFTIPAAYDEVITASAIVDTDGLGGGAGSPSTWWGPDDTLATFSNWGFDIDLAAPGVDILSTFTGGTYALMSGTSMSTPHVAGAAALYLQNPPGKKDKGHPKPRSQDGVYVVKAALQAAGFAYGSPNGFTMDRDVFNEPVVDAEDLVAPEMPRGRN